MTYAEKKWGDCSKAVAYQFNFVKLVYGYPTDCYDDYFYRLLVYLAKAPKITLLVYYI